MRCALTQKICSGADKAIDYNKTNPLGDVKKGEIVGTDLIFPGGVASLKTWLLKE